MRSIYKELSENKRQEMIKSLKPLLGQELKEKSLFQNMILSGAEGTELYKLGINDLEKDVQKRLGVSSPLGDIIIDPWCIDYLNLKRLLWSSSADFILDLGITLPSYESLWENIREEIIVEREYEVDANGNRKMVYVDVVTPTETYIPQVSTTEKRDSQGNIIAVVSTTTWTKQTGEKTTKELLLEDGNVVYVTKEVTTRRVRGYITLYYGFDDRRLIYSIEDKCYYGISKTEGLKSKDSRNLKDIFLDQYAALI